MSERYELEVTTQSGAEHSFDLQATNEQTAEQEAKAFLTVMKARGWLITKAQVVSIRKTGVLTIPLD